MQQARLLDARLVPHLQNTRLAKSYRHWLVHRRSKKKDAEWLPVQFFIFGLLDFSDEAVATLCSVRTKCRSLWTENSRGRWDVFELSCLFDIGSIVNIVNIACTI